MTELDNQKERIAGLLARKSIPVEEIYTTDEEIHILYEQGVVDPTLVVQLIERNTNSIYQGEDETENENILNLKFS